MHTKYYLLLIAICAASNLLYGQDYSQDNSLKKETLFYDDFDNNRNRWTKDNTLVPSEQTFYNGYYYWTSLSSNKSASTSTEIDLDPNQDFEIETRYMIHSAAKRTTLQSLVFGSDGKNKYFFGYTGEGSYRISKYDGSYSAIKNWTDSPHINKSGFNKLTIRKKNDLMHFFINDNPVYIADFREFYGNRIGFSVASGSKIKADYLRVSYLGDKGKVYSSYTDEDKDYFLNEEFDTNEFGWKTDGENLYVSEGVYTIRTIGRQGRIIAKDFNTFQKDRNFELEYELRLAKGKNDDVISVVWDLYSKPLQYLNFSLSQGSYSFSKFHNNKFDYLMKWTKDNSIDFTRYNKLTIRRIENTYYLFINEKLVHSITLDKPGSPKWGVKVPDNASIQIRRAHMAYLD